MIRVNKNIFKFLSIILLSGAFLIIILQKISPLLSHTVYYCQTYINSISISIPYLMTVLPVILFFSLLKIALGKGVFVVVKAQTLKKKLMENVTSDKKFSKALMKLKLQEKTMLIKSNKPFAFCLGIVRPKIYISTKMISLMDKAEVEAILRHEKYHLENKDSFVMLLASMGESLLPFFPLLSDLLHNYRIEREVKADNEAIKELGHSASIVSVLRKLLAYPSFATIPVSAIADQGTLEPRIRAIVKKDFQFKKYKVKNMLISFLSLTVLSFTIIAPVQAFDLHDEKNDIMMLCPNGDSCAKWCTENNTVIPQYSSMPLSLKQNSSQSFSPFHK